MAQASKMVKPRRHQLLQLEVLRSEHLSPGFRRVTFSHGDIKAFEPMGYDQWFRLFLPTTNADTLDKIPPNANQTLGYLRFLTIGERPLMRNYTVRAFREQGADGPELDIDFVIHGPTDDPTASAVAWATHCRPGDRVAIINEGIGFNPERGTDHVLLIADETGLPAVAGIIASLPETARGLAIIELPDPADVQDLHPPTGVEVHYVMRQQGTPAGRLAHATASRHIEESPLPQHAFVVGEIELVQGIRRLLVTAGVAKDAISFCSYYKRSH